MKALLKKEFMLCLHPTAFIFLAFCLFVFIPNYPYEVMFFFSGLSIFFISLTARENGDAEFTATMPEMKGKIPCARILMAVVFQTALLLLAAITTTVKGLALPTEMQVNLAGNPANLAFLGYGALLVGIFNIVFFPMHYKNPNKVGVPFLVAALAQFFIIAVLIALRWTAPLFTERLASLDPAFMGEKAIVFTIGIIAYALLTLLAIKRSVHNFSKFDL